MSEAELKAYFEANLPRVRTEEELYQAILHVINDQKDDIAASIKQGAAGISLKLNAETDACQIIREGYRSKELESACKRAQKLHPRFLFMSAHMSGGHVAVFIKLDATCDLPLRLLLD